MTRARPRIIAIDGPSGSGKGTIARRVAAALTEMRHVGEFEYVIINNKLPEAIEDLQTVVRSVRLRYNSQLARHRVLFSFIEQDT